ncbi:MAG: peptidylprolyl isomerase [bacterium]|nr:peptidylprolyl isomerase [bacterium]
MSTQLAACTTSSDSTRSGATISGDNPTATIETRLGTFELELFADKIPEISKNFIELAKAGKYDGVPFHRVIKDFMIQGGDFENKNGTGGHSYKGPGTELAGEFDSEVSSNLRGTIAMANRGPDTNGSQFFINLVDNTRLDHDKAPLSSAHPVFGKVIEGMDVVDAIGKVQTGPGDRPAEEVLMTKVTIQE